MLTINLGPVFLLVNLLLPTGPTMMVPRSVSIALNPLQIRTPTSADHMH
jgi:hypothetical protein